MSARVAVLGLGNMGAAIAARLADAGADLRVWNRSPGPTEAFAARGVPVAATPAEATAHSDVVVTMLADAAAVEAVVLGPDGVLAGAPGAAPAPVLVEMSTIDAATSAALADELEAAGVGYVRAPVSGNPTVVTAGSLGILTSGPPADVERVGAVLDRIGPRRWHLGPGEEARVLKLALNTMVAGTTQLLAEALGLAEGHGLDRADVLEVVGGSAVGSPFVGYKTRPLVEHDLTPTFSARLMRKDLALALDAGRAAGTELPVAGLVASLLDACIAEGHGEEDLLTLVEQLGARRGAAPA